MPTVLCPAGEAIDEVQVDPNRLLRAPACRCRVERRNITPMTDPATFHGYCTAPPGEKRTHLLFAVHEDGLMNRVEVAEAVQLRKRGVKIIRVAGVGYVDCYSWQTAKMSNFVADLASEGGDWWVRTESGRIEYQERVPADPFADD